MSVLQQTFFGVRLIQIEHLVLQPGIHRAWYRVTIHRVGRGGI